MIKAVINRCVKRPGPSFLPSWQDQKFGKIPSNYAETDGYFLVAGFPKSGNVWLTSMIAECLNLPVGKDKKGCKVYYVHSPLNDKTLYDPLLYRGVALVRDLRDIIVSLFHWLKTDGYKNYHKHGPHQVFDDVETMYIEFFLRRFVQMRPEAMLDGYVARGWPLIKYERLWDNPRRELERLFEIWGIDVGPDVIERAVERNRIDRLQKEGGALEVYIERDHFRKGGYDQYRKEIPKHIVEDIEDRFGDYLRSWGYSTEHRPSRS